VKLLASIGRGEPRSDPALDELRAARLAAARKCQAWTEVEEVDLVKRAVWLVSATTDELFSRYTGATFGRTGRIEFAAEQPLVFYVNRNADVVVLEKCQSPSTWSEVVEKQAKARHLKAVS
jgi:hypothetical protein